MNGSSQKIFAKKQTATLRRVGERGHFWAEGIVFASQFEESGFDISLTQQILSAIVSRCSFRLYPRNTQRPSPWRGTSGNHIDTSYELCGTEDKRTIDGVQLFLTLRNCGQNRDRTIVVHIISFAFFEQGDDACGFPF